MAVDCRLCKKMVVLRLHASAQRNAADAAVVKPTPAPALLVAGAPQVSDVAACFEALLATGDLMISVLGLPEGCQHSACSVDDVTFGDDAPVVALQVSFSWYPGQGDNCIKLGSATLHVSLALALTAESALGNAGLPVPVAQNVLDAFGTRRLEKALGIRPPSSLVSGAVVADGGGKETSTTFHIPVDYTCSPSPYSMCLIGGNQVIALQVMSEPKKAAGEADVAPFAALSSSASDVQSF